MQIGSIQLLFPCSQQANASLMARTHLIWEKHELYVVVHPFCWTWRCSRSRASWAERDREREWHLMYTVSKPDIFELKQRPTNQRDGQDSQLVRFFFFSVFYNTMFSYIRYYRRKLSVVEKSSFCMSHLITSLTKDRGCIWVWIGNEGYMVCPLLRSHDKTQMV